MICRQEASAGVAKSGKGDGLKTRSRRSPQVQILPPAYFTQKYLLLNITNTKTHRNH